MLYGVKPVIIAVVAQALWGLGRSAVTSIWLGAVVALGRAAVRRKAPPAAGWAPLSFVGALTGPATGAATAVGLGPLFWVFLKIGAVLFGSGYVLLAFLRSDLVERLHWLTESQLLDAVAVGQVTPGPLVPRIRNSPTASAGGCSAGRSWAPQLPMDLGDSRVISNHRLPGHVTEAISHK